MLANEKEIPSYVFKRHNFYCSQAQPVQPVQPRSQILPLQRSQSADDSFDIPHKIDILASQTTIEHHPRRRLSVNNIPNPPPEISADSNSRHKYTAGSNSRPGASSSLPARAFAQLLTAVPNISMTSVPMSLSRSPSPRPNGGWSSKGLTENGMPFRKPLSSTDDVLEKNVQWNAARAKSEAVRGYPSIQTKNEGFFQRSRRKISATLPAFQTFNGDTRNWRDQEKLGRGRWHPKGSGKFSTLKTFVGNVLRKFKFIFMVLAAILLLTIIMSQTHATQRYRSNSRLGGGSNFVIILAVNKGGGVMEWKGSRQWAIERDSIKNKQKYAEKWGYHLELADVSTKKRYAHEWRESWEKSDIIRNCMAKYPKAEWFWWLDLNTFIMEPSISLQHHIFNDLAQNTYRDINVYNPLKIKHPPELGIFDPVTRSPTGDNLTSSIDMIIPQDCSGFNLGSFFVRRSDWTDRLLDIWWDPVLYEQRHQEWEHAEQDALEHIYTNHAGMRTHFAFIEQRKINAFPPAACGTKTKEGEYLLHPRYHYNQNDRDFLVNMAGCEWGRDCWAEIYAYRELSKALNRGGWERFQDQTEKKWREFWGITSEEDEKKMPPKKIKDDKEHDDGKDDKEHDDGKDETY